MIPTTRRYRGNRGEWPLRYEVTNREPSITAKLQPYLESQATLDWLMNCAYWKMFFGDIDGNQLQPKITNNKYRAPHGNGVAKK